MNPYLLIFFNSLQASFVLSLRSENAWRAALAFGNYNMALATLIAVAASTLGMMLNFSIGYYVSRWRDELPGFSEGLYQRVSTLFQRKLYLFMIIPPLMVLEVVPMVSIFVVTSGLFRVSPPKALCAIMLSRILYYTYYLTHTGM